MTGFSIAREVKGSKGRYVLTHPDGQAVLTYSIMSPTRIIADHTEVDDGLRGSGAGRVLVERLVTDAMEEGVKILPLCPFVNAERRKHADWAEVFSV